jgi:hypothetical protein
MEGEDNRLVRGEQRVEPGILQAVRVLGFGLQFHQIDDVDNPDLQVRQVLPGDGYRGQHLQRWYVTGACHYNIWFPIALAAGPLVCTAAGSVKSSAGT